MMKEQARGGHIFNMDGAGADGNPTPRYSGVFVAANTLSIYPGREKDVLDFRGLRFQNLCTSAY